MINIVVFLSWVHLQVFCMPCLYAIIPSTKEYKFSLHNQNKQAWYKMKRNSGEEEVASDYAIMYCLPHQNIKTKGKN